MSLSHTYRICDLVLDSNTVLPELNPEVSFDAECRFELLPAGSPLPDDVDWFHHWTFEESDGENEKDSAEAWLRLGRIANGYLLRFLSCGDFFVSADTLTIQCRPLPGTPEVTVRHLLLDQVIPLVLSRRERIVLHASAVLTSHGVIAFAGKSGQGKSTLAASLAREGHALVSDDCLVLRAEHGGWTAIPSYPGVRLWPTTIGEILREDTRSFDVAHYTVKRRLGETDVLPHATGPAPLRRLFFLADDAGEVYLEKLSPGRAIMSLVAFAHNLDIQDAAFLRKQFDTVVRLTEDVPAYAIHYPREFGALPAVQEAILKNSEEDRDRDAE
jgi:hypothetical protein